MSFVPDAFLRLAGAIALETLALTVWNVGTRSPLALLRDVARAGRNPRKLLEGFISLLIGLIFVAASTILLLPDVPAPSVNLVPLEIFTFLAALSIEYLVGGDLRNLGRGSHSKLG
jgi:hypothetical protein